MYFDTHEQAEMQKLVMSFHAQWFTYTMKRISAFHTWLLLLLILFFHTGLLIIFWTMDANEHRSMIWMLYGAFIILLLFSYHRYSKQVKQRLENNSLEKWYQEIDELDADGDDRQLFLQLLSATQNSSTKAGLASIVQEASQSPILSRLSLVCELRDYIH